MTLPLAPDGIWWTLQGEGHLSGVPMAFVRLAGCSVGCAGCDTDYRVSERTGVDDIVSRVAAVTPAKVRERWVWITGGEPTDHDLTPLLLALKRAGHLVAVATAGERNVADPVDWLSVSPHRVGRLAQRFGHEIKLVLGGGMTDDVMAQREDAERADYWFRYVQPFTRPDGSPDPAAVQWCHDWIARFPNWALSEQRHRQWGVR